MTKRALLLLSLLAVPCVVTSCKDDAAPGTSITTESPLDKICNLLKLSGRLEKEIKILRAGYEGDTVTLESLKDKKHIGIYCTGAAATGNKELVLQCLDKGAKPNSGLVGAALGGHMDIVQLMLSKGADPDWGLDGAALGGYLDIVQLMLDKGATDYDWGLSVAALGGHMDIVQLMLNKGAHPNAGLEGAAKGGHMDIVQLMLSKGATNLDLALSAAMTHGHTECAELIRAAMMNDNTAAPNTKTAAPDTSITTESPLDKLCRYWELVGYLEKDIKIFRAGYEGDTVTLENLKDKGLIDFYCTGAAAAGNKVLVIQRLDNGTKPDHGLKGAALGGHMDIVQLMLSKGATDYNWGLYCAALGGHMDIVQLMLSKGADPEKGLAGAALGGHMEIVQLLLAKGATDYDDGLRGAAEGGHMDIVQLMLAKGADPNFGLEDAAWRGHMDIVQLLLSKGATNYNQGLWYAAEGGHMEIVQLMISKGATDLDSALEAAEDNGHTECAALIRAAMKK